MKTNVPLRVSILALLSESRSPLSLADLHSKLGDVSKSAVLHWLQSLVEEKVIVRIDDNYALLDKAAYSVNRDIVTLSSMTAVVSSGTRGTSATLYGESLKEKVSADEFKTVTDDFIDRVVKLMYPNIRSIEAASKTADAEKLVGLKFSVVLNFDGTKLLAAGGEDLKDLTKRAMKLLSKYGPMSVEEIAAELKISAVEAYQATYPLLSTSLAQTEGDGRIKLLIKVAE
jgi:predicted transcriptional regulator